MKTKRDFEGRWVTRKDGTEYYYSAEDQAADYGDLKYHEEKNRDNDDRHYEGKK